MKKLALTVVALAALMTPALAAEAERGTAEQGLVELVAAEQAAEQASDELNSVERGKDLFHSTRLGSNGKSCATCHPDGDNLHDAASYKETRLVKIVNMCIRSMLAGKPLPAESDDMASLVKYLRTFAEP